MSTEGQALCFMAGAGSIFAGDKLLTTPNPDLHSDLDMFELLGLQPTPAYRKHEKREPQAEEETPSPERQIKWSRPGHTIEQNVAYAKKG
jgi:biotin synthase